MSGVAHTYRRFFFQAEDGIRALYVTGVQTCALPISFTPVAGETRRTFSVVDDSRVTAFRSEERRVGKECRSRRSPDHLNNISSTTLLCREIVCNDSAKRQSVC